MTDLFGFFFSLVVVGEVRVVPQIPQSNPYVSEVNFPELTSQVYDVT